jgi:Uma2 family endonuclease
MPISAETYERVALEDDDRVWELHCGRLVEKPGVTVEHADVLNMLAVMLGRQLDPGRYRVRANTSRTRWSPAGYFVPDVCVVPDELAQKLRGTGALEVYTDPLPFVAEVWSPSTGRYDVNTKLPEYQRRGDAEIWRIHPYERTLITWRRQADGTYTETVLTEGAIEPIALPNVRIDLASLFDWE